MRVLPHRPSTLNPQESPSGPPPGFLLPYFAASRGPGICPGSDLDATSSPTCQTPSTPRSPSPPPPPSPLPVFSKKRLRKSTLLQQTSTGRLKPPCQFPAASPSTLPVPDTSTSFTPQAVFPLSSQVIPPAFFGSPSNALQGPISSLTKHLRNFSSSAAKRQRCLPPLVPGVLRPFFLTPPSSLHSG
ncbi:hypothetical protein CRENBAI_007065 [Crenichthys baileyi]|uniref:Uncharacterized protein n=1 Tax=Crenichthys baileyi TaxID=28760 RepID=A0AAV9RN58_9TELE